MHIPVLLHESIDNLQIEKGETFLDGTLGSGGHSALVAERLGNKITIVALDRDGDAIKRSAEKLRTLGARTFFKKESFRHLDRTLEEFGIESVDAMLFDLGISSDQLEESGRGFSFKKDEPLLMTMSDEVGESDLTAEKIINNFSESAIELILRGFGEEKYSKKIAREIVSRREKNPIRTTFALLEAVQAAVPASYRRGRINPATKTFQALRIAVNEELEALEEGLEKGFQALNLGGRLAVISFHSLEDRIVKNYFKKLASENKAKIITKKPITPSDEEVEQNPRSRSAKLRVIERSDI